MQGGLFTGQGTRTPGEDIKALAESGIQAFNVSGVDAAAALSNLNESRYHLSTSLNNATGDLQFVPRASLDDLNDGDFSPGDQSWTSDLASMQWAAESILERSHIAGPAIYGE